MHASAWLPPAHAQALPRITRIRTPRRKPRFDTDVEDLEPDWSQLNADTATLLLSPAAKARAAKGLRRLRHVVDIQEQGEWLGRKCR